MHNKFFLPNFIQESVSNCLHCSFLTKKKTTLINYDNITIKQNNLKVMQKSNTFMLLHKNSLKKTRASIEVINKTN